MQRVSVVSNLIKSFFYLKTKLNRHAKIKYINHPICIHFRMNEVRGELQRLLSYDELIEVPFLILANKQDLPNAMPPHEIREQLDEECFVNRATGVFGVCATFGDAKRTGLSEAFSWLSDAMLRGHKRHEIRKWVH